MSKLILLPIFAILLGILDGWLSQRKRINTWLVPFIGGLIMGHFASGAVQAVTCPLLYAAALIVALIYFDDDDNIRRRLKNAMSLALKKLIEKVNEVAPTPKPRPLPA